jgi:hypothetical protein
MFLSSRQVPHYSFVSLFFFLFNLLLCGGRKEKGKGGQMEKVRSVQRVYCFEKSIQAIVTEFRRFDLLKQDPVLLDLGTGCRHPSL